MEKITPIWYSRTGDRIRIKDKQYDVLGKSLIPLRNEVGFLLEVKSEDRTEHSWIPFHWDPKIIRVN